MVERRTFGQRDQGSKPAMVECWTFGQGDWCSKPSAVVSKPERFQSPQFARIFWKC